MNYKCFGRGLILNEIDETIESMIIHRRLIIARQQLYQANLRKKINRE
jgi:hypothetical protein